MTVGITKVPGVDPPGTVMRLIRQRCARRFCALEQGVDVSFGTNDVADTESARCRRLDRDVRSLRQLRSGIQRQEQTVSKFEDRDRPRGCRLVTGELGCDHSARVEPEAVAIELEGAIEVEHGECDYVNARLHPPASVSGVTPDPWAPNRRIVTCRSRSGTSRRISRTSALGSTACRTWSFAPRPKRSSSRNRA